MILTAFLLFIAGMFLSAFFSGSETGLYRVTRVRLALDGMTGDPVSRGLLWLVNNPAAFVATSLVGNNLANFMVSRAIVSGTQGILGRWAIAEVLMPLLVAPFVFVYGELLPKNLYFLAPNKLLRRGGPFFLVCAILFAPFTALLWLLGRVLSRLVGESPEIVRLELARKELMELLNQGQEAGILQPVQHNMSQAVFECGSNPVRQYATAASRLLTVKSSDSRSSLLRTARRNHTPELLVAGEKPHEYLGYVRVIDLHLASEEWQNDIRPLPVIKQNDSHMSAMMTLQDAKQTLGRLIDMQNRTIGIVSFRRLAAPLYRA